jgi:hypothetical protein
MTADAPKKPQPKKPYTAVRRSLWDSKRFNGLPDDLCRYLYLYLLTCSHQGGAGCFVAKERYILADLQKPGSDWTEETYRDRLQRLITAGLILADAATSEILIVGWWSDNGPTNDKWFAGARRYCEAIESATLKEAAQTALAECWDSFLALKNLPPARPALRLSGDHITAADRLSSLAALGAR